MDVYPAGATVPIYFTTNDAAGAAVAPSSAFEAADVKLYKGTSATERSSQAGWTMTSPFDSLTGLHLLVIDTSDNTDAGFYAEGSVYTAVLSPDETVDSQAVVAVIGRFQLGPVIANMVQISDDAGAADNAEAMFDGTGYAGGTAKLQVNATQIEGADATDQIRDAILSDATRFAGANVGAIKAKTDNLPASPAATGDAMTLASNAVSAAALAADAVAEILAGILAGTVTIPTAPPTAPYTVEDILGWLLAVCKFGRSQSSTTETVYGDDGTTPIGTAAKSDNGTTFTRAEYAAP